MREFRAEVPGGAITAWQAGTGPAVLILHGGPGLSDYTVEASSPGFHRICARSARSGLLV
jgi:hypothetical protein